MYKALYDVVKKERYNVSSSCLEKGRKTLRASYGTMSASCSEESMPWVDVALTWMPVEGFAGNQGRTSVFFKMHKQSCSEGGSTWVDTTLVGAEHVSSLRLRSMLHLPYHIVRVIGQSM